MPLTEIQYHEPSAAIFCWDRSSETCLAWSYLAHRPLPNDAPDEARAIAAQHWTPAVIEAAKNKMARRRKAPTPPPVLSPMSELSVRVDTVVGEVAALKLLPTSPPVVAERVQAAEQRADSNFASMGRMVMDTKNEMTLAAKGLQAQIDGLNKELADIRSKAN
jgi:hypothetical protein